MPYNSYQHSSILINFNQFYVNQSTGNRDAYEAMRIIEGLKAKPYMTGRDSGYNDTSPGYNTHTHTHTQSHMQTHIHTYTHANTLSYICNTRIAKLSHKHKVINLHAHTNLHVHA